MHPFIQFHECHIPVKRMKEGNVHLHEGEGLYEKEQHKDYRQAQSQSPGVEEDVFDIVIKR